MFETLITLAALLLAYRVAKHLRLKKLNPNSLENQSC